ncbi:MULTISPECIES: hypothetical protein [Alicyclobacillus]|nr:hypothetical protein [Alicyclobacillus mali (ex Roth et al. 2021)]
MLSILAFLPRVFRYFGMFQMFFGFVRPFWPMISRVWRRPAVAAA